MQAPITGFNKQFITPQANVSLNQQQTAPYHGPQHQGWHTINNGILPTYHSWSNHSAITYSAASTCASPCAPNHVMTNANRILGMETTVEYLKELLTKEFETSVKFKTTVKALTSDVEKAKLINQNLKLEFQKAQAEKTQVNSKLQDALVAQHELVCSSIINQKELLDAKNELITAQKSINDLKTINSSLESKVNYLVAELQHQGERKEPDMLLSPGSKTVETSDNECVCSAEKSLLNEKETDHEILRAQFDLLKDELNSAVQMRDVVSCMFKELGKKYLYMIEYSGEQMYSDYEENHVKFIGQLNSLKGNLTNDIKCSFIEHTLDCLKEQLKLLEDCREEFRVSIELLMCRIDQEFALVSDLSIRPRKPLFQIPIEDFEQLLQVIAQIGGPEPAMEINPENLIPFLKH